MIASTTEIVRRADHIVRTCGTRDARRIAEALGVAVVYCPFRQQRGAYKVILRNRFLFVKEDLSPVMESIVMLHELGHDQLHRHEATRTGGFKEFNIFDVRDSRMEYEANVFATQVALPDDAFLELVGRGYDVQQIAEALRSDVNLVALKADTLISRGYRLRAQEHKNDFLRYDR
jgi:Zn-dependent peptidase ImmA (M78 family)